jgi:hypothetical protein
MAAKKKSARSKGKTAKPASANGEIKFTVNLKQSGLASKEIKGIKNNITKALAQGAMGKAEMLRGEPYVKILYVQQTFGRKIR